MKQSELDPEDAAAIGIAFMEALPEDAQWGESPVECFVALQDKCAELEADAARYRWLKERRGDGPESWFYKRGPIVTGDRPVGVQVLGGDWLDHAVDKAMAEPSSQPRSGELRSPAQGGR